MTIIDTANHPNYETKKKFVEALFADDWDTLASVTHPDFELHEPPALPYGGVHKGVDGFHRCWDLIRQGMLATESLETVRTLFAEDPDHIVDLLDFRGKFRTTGQHAASLIYEEWEFKDGKVYRLRLYWFDMPDFGPRAQPG